MDLAHHAAVRRLVEAAIAEDIGRGDVTTASALAPDLRAAAAVVAQEPCIVAGSFLAPLVWGTVDPSLVVECVAVDGTAIDPSHPIAIDGGEERPSGRARANASHERGAEQ